MSIDQTKIEQFISIINSNKLILLGDPEHGVSSLELIKNFYKLKKFKLIENIFLENIPYNNGLNYKLLIREEEK